MAKLSAVVMKDDYFRKIVATQKYECEAVKRLRKNRNRKKKAEDSYNSDDSILTDETEYVAR